MMKTRIQIIVIFLASMLIGCEEYLDTKPRSITAVENFYESAADAEIALNGVYNVLTASHVQGIGNQSTYSTDLMYILNGATDECFWNKNRTNVTYSPWGTAGFTTQDNLINVSWFSFYAGINRANYLIEQLDDINDFSDNRKVEVEAEAKLLRGFYHMILSMLHGAIPVNTSSLDDPKMERKNIEEVYTQIISDYEFAYENLSDRAPLKSHVNKWTAAGLLAKVHTYIASMKKSNISYFGFALNSFDWVDADAHYSKALTYTTATINNSGYILIPEYFRLFRENTKSDQYLECMFLGEASNDPTASVVNQIIRAFIPQGNRDAVGGGYGELRPSGELWYMYSDKDIRRANNLTGNLPYSASLETIDGVSYYVPVVIKNPNGSNYSIGKYRMRNPAEKNLPYWSTNLNLPLLRYADILLLHAEAQFFTGDESGARNTLTIIRSRALAENAVVDDLNNTYYKSDFVDELLEERARELCFENWRRIDLSRFNKYTQTVESLSTNLGRYNMIVPTIQQNWKDERIWLPIPLQQIDLNPNLVQNPGY